MAKAYSVMQHNAVEDKYGRHVEPMRLCPRFNRCSAPICPLDSLQEERDYLPGEPKCTLSKARRFVIGKDSNLPRKGLTKREWATKLRWDAMSETEKTRKTAHLRPFSPICIRDLKATSENSIKGRVNGKT